MAFSVSAQKLVFVGIAALMIVGTIVVLYPYNMKSTSPSSLKSPCSEESKQCIDACFDDPEIFLGLNATADIMNESRTFFSCLSKCLDPSTCSPYQTNATNLIKDSFSPENYGKFLEKKADMDPSVQEEMEQFSKLTDDEKQKFMLYLNDIDVIKEIFSIEVFGNETGGDHSLYVGSGDHSDKQELYNGDIEIIEDITEVSPPEGNFQIFAKTVERTVKHTHRCKILGVTVAKFSISCRYKTSGKEKVTSIISASDGWANYIPLIDISRVGSIEKYISGNKAHAEGTYLVKGSIPLVTSWISVTFIHAVHGYPDGKMTYSFYQS